MVLLPHSLLLTVQQFVELGDQSFTNCQNEWAPFVIIHLWQRWQAAEFRWRIHHFIMIHQTPTDVWCESHRCAQTLWCSPAADSILLMIFYCCTQVKNFCVNATFCFCARYEIFMFLLSNSRNFILDRSDQLWRLIVLVGMGLSYLLLLYTWECNNLLCFAFICLHERLFEMRGNFPLYFHYITFELITK